MPINNTHEEPQTNQVLKINLDEQRDPYSIVWTPLPLLSYICPTIGHVGICTSEGIIHDFGGSGFIGVDNMTFGKPYKYMQLYKS